ncbi:calcineurin-dependent [Metarhizium album ARSEF 1941]|uniref:Calcineurin-dependent n=1 Tax=Metarhizium album (strain ARSEF 1941) TaxID=1081103 RepID=A0A0B2X084_METAS|nr:calcineurin-dependent [Metarhizium album ARSEF 1941]KHN99703.1 calcineurin-dependent [Metarhizium album ARSEF 1941]
MDPAAHKLRRGIMDIIMKLCFGRDVNCTGGSRESAAIVDSMITLSRSFALIKHFPILGTAMQSFPSPILARILPGFVDFRKVSCCQEKRSWIQMLGLFVSGTSDMFAKLPQQCAAWVAEVRERHQNGVCRDESGRQTVFDAILEAEPERTTKGLVDEAFSLVVGARRPR